VKLGVIAPHFAPDVAPTGTVVTRLVEELAARNHRIEVITSLPWYRLHAIEPEFAGKLKRTEDTPWGRITRLHPFPASDKGNLVARAAAFAAFTALAGIAALPGEPLDGVLAISPPLPIGLAGWAAARKRHASFVFNVQDVFPDVAIELGAVSGEKTIAAARRLERLCYNLADAVTVLSDDLKENVSAKTDASKVHVIPNFVDVDVITPGDRENSYRREFGLEGKTVVMYAGNVGLSQSLDLVLEAAGALAYEESLVFVINGEGAAKASLEERARGLSNVRFIGMQPAARLPEVIAAGDIHLVPLKRGLAKASVPSKTYSILAAGRPLIASVDEGSEIARIVERTGAGLAVPPEDAETFTKAIRNLLDAPERLQQMGEAGRAFVESWASPAAVAIAYEELFEELRRSREP
jgi:colanic acid biosynthesis glycosyl transferase WcaI